MGHTSLACAPTESISLSELFRRLIAAGCTRLSVNEYIVHEPLCHGDSVAYQYARVSQDWSAECDLVELPVSYSDYGGSDLDAANVRALVETFGESTFVHLYGGHDSTGLALPYGRSLPDDEENERLTFLVETIEALADYPLISDETHSRYVAELAAECWDQWVRSDTVHELCEYAPTDDASDAVHACDEDAFVSAYYGCESNEWTCETATSVVNLRHDDAVRHVARSLFGWDV